MRAAPWVLGAAATLIVASMASSGSAAEGREPGASAALEDDGRPILVIGDSYAVGIAAALRSLYPGRDIRSVAVGGTSSPSMMMAPDDDLFVVVSTGTNDVGIHEPAPKTVEGILRVLGSYAAHTASRGRLFYLLPHSDMGGGLGSRTAALRTLLAPRLHATERFRFGTPDSARPASDGDGIHFDASGYRSIAQQAIAALAPGGVERPHGSSGGSKSGLLPNGDMDPAFRARAELVAERTGIPLAYLLAIMDFESGGTFRSDVQNPKSHATGLIQFMPKLNGKVMRYPPDNLTTDELAQLNAVEQLDSVEAHFRRFGSFAGRKPSDAYLAVFSPGMMGRADDFPYYVEAGNERGKPVVYEQNKGLDANHDGQITVGEVRRIILPSLAKVRARGWA